MAVDRHQCGVQHRAPVLLAGGVPDDDVHGAGLVLDRDEGDAARGAWALAAGDDAGGAHALLVACGADAGGGQIALRIEALAQQRQRMAAQRQRRVVIVGDDVLAFGRRQQVDRRLAARARGERCGARRVGIDAERGPQRPAAVAGQRGQRIGLGQRADLAAIELRAACQVLGVGEGRVAPCGHDAFAGRFVEAGDEFEPESYGRHRGRDGSAARRRERAVPVADGDVDRPDFDAMVHRIAHDLRRRIKPQRLRVEQRGAERGRLVALEPRRHVHQQREARGVALRESRIRRSPGSAGRSARRTRSV